MAKLRIDELLEERSRSAYWLANEIGMGHGNLWKYRKNRTNTVNIQILEKICKALECTPNDLILLVDEKSGSQKKSKVK